jgi:hypothetical protein
MSVRHQLVGAPDMSYDRVAPGQIEVDIDGEIALRGTPESLEAVGTAMIAAVASYRATYENAAP